MVCVRLLAQYVCLHRLRLIVRCSIRRSLLSRYRPLENQTELLTVPYAVLCDLAITIFSSLTERS